MAEIENNRQGGFWLDQRSKYCIMSFHTKIENRVYLKVEQARIQCYFYAPASHFPVNVNVWLSKEEISKEFKYVVNRLIGAFKLQIQPYLTFFIYLKGFKTQFR